MSLPDRIISGRSAERSRRKSAAPMARTCASVCAYVMVRQPPLAGSRSAMNTRCGVRSAQWISRSVIRAG